MTYMKSQIIPNFKCEDCAYNTISKKDFSKHLETIKHKKKTNSYEIVTNSYAFGEKSPKQYCCECGKSYNHRQNLYTHRKKCNFKNENSDKNDKIIN